MKGVESYEQEREVRPATASDIAAIAAVFRSARQHNLPYLADLHTPEEDVEYFSENVLKKARIVVAEEAGRVVAFCAYRDRWLDHLYVLPEYQGRGLGLALLDRAKSESAELQLWVFQKNEAARLFYERKGFELAEVTDGGSNEEREPDARYVWKRSG